ncbi:hypothetical protein [Spiroplasma sp. DGKH1]|uniref:hypothetical protein n=1 Tax=Spiroplasma sp. DGKH1 TaxID=3050074 RepID=UPI0034C5D33A
MKDLIKPIITYYGDKQIIQAIEEMAELQKELCKNLKGKTNKELIKEELADCFLILEQLKVYYNFNDQEIQDIMMLKLNRTVSVINSQICNSFCIEEQNKNQITSFGKTISGIGIKRNEHLKKIKSKFEK